MGQAWCKERTTKAQDSKSPLDRVFLRCAHQIYPNLKEEGSVLGGATQRVTSSEIGYAGSPPREALARGQSIDSVDRPFHPSEWVDVNLEVPNTPRDSSVVTNLTTNTNLTRATSLYPSTTLASSGSNSKDATPIPPPRRRRRNRGRPLPPKPDEIVETHKSIKLIKNIKEEPLYSSVKSPKTNATFGGDKDNDEPHDGENGSSLSGKPTEDMENSANHAEKNEGKSGSEIHEFKVKGTDKVIPNIEITQNWTRTGEEENHRMMVDDRDYEQFSENQLIRNTSTPSRVDTHMKESRANELKQMVTKTADLLSDGVIADLSQRSKKFSAVSLPNYDELEEVKNEVEKEDEREEEGTAPKKPARNASTASLPMETIVSPLSQATAERVKNYVSRCRSFGSLLPHEIMDKLNSHGEQIGDSSDEDGWGGLDDWDLGVEEHYEESDGRSPLEPSSRLPERKVSTPKFNIGGENIVTSSMEEVGKEAVSNTSESPVSPKKEQCASEKEATESKDIREPSNQGIPRNTSFTAPKSPNSLKSALKDQAKRKISMPARLASANGDQSSPLEDWFSEQERSVRFIDSPVLQEEYKNTPGHRPARPARPQAHHIQEQDYDPKSYLFNGSSSEPLHSDTFFGVELGGITGSMDSPGTYTDKKQFPNNSNILTRTLSNESEPFEGYEEKELTMDIRSQSSISKISRTISDESIPEDMIDDDFFDEKLTKDTRNKMTEISASRDSNAAKTLKTPPPSPEPKIKAEILDNDHSTLLKVLKEEREGEESNLSSMTPSLTELEAALSDMLEKEDKDEEDVQEETPNNDLQHSASIKSLDKPIEPKIVPVEKSKSHATDSSDKSGTTDLREIPNNSRDIHEVVENSNMKMTKSESLLGDKVENISNAASQVVKESINRVGVLAENVKDNIGAGATEFDKTTQQLSADVNSIRKEAKNDLGVSLEQILNNTVGSMKKIADQTDEGLESLIKSTKVVETDPTNRKISSDSQENKMENHQEPGFTEREVATKIVKAIFKNPYNHPFEDVTGMSKNVDGLIDENGDYRMKEDASKTEVDDNFSTNPFDGPNPFDEPPEKPSRLHKINLNEPEIPTPPQRRNRHSLGVKNTANTSELESTTEFPIKDSSPHPHDRLI